MDFGTSVLTLFFRPVKATEAREMAQKLFNSKARGESVASSVLFAGGNLVIIVFTLKSLGLLVFAIHVRIRFGDAEATCDHQLPLPFPQQYPIITLSLA